MASRRVRTVLLAALLAVPFAGVEATLTAEAAGAAVTTYTDATISGPSGIATGPDGALWFANSSNNSIGRITTNGTVTNYSGHGISRPGAIAVGPDGALWFTSAGNRSIGRISTKGVITLHSVGLASNSITAGPDGNLWFTSSRFPTSYVGRFNITTGKTTRFTGNGVYDPRQITAGSDGALWFANYGRGAGSIGRITTSGVISYYGEGHPEAIAAGSDGALWFTDNSLCSCEADLIGRITTKGTTTTHTDPTVVDPGGITPGPDGALWFINANTIGRISTAGTITNTTDPGITTPSSITTGPDGAVWFTTSADNSIGRISLPGPTRSKPSAPRTATVVPFGNGTAKISWQPPASSGGSPILGYVVTPYVSGVAQPSRLFNNPRATTALVTGLTNRTQYRFTVAARNAIGRSTATPRTAAMVAGAPGPPGRPKAVKVAPGSLKVTFTPPATHGVAISSYSATCTSSNQGVTKTWSAATGPITVNGLTPGKTYTCTAAARNSVGTGPSSPPSTAVNA